MKSKPNNTDKVVIKFLYANNRSAFVTGLRYRILNSRDLDFLPERDCGLDADTPPESVLVFDIKKDKDLISKIEGMLDHDFLRVYGLKVRKMELVPASSLRCKKVNAGRQAFLQMFATISGELKLIPSGFAFNNSAA